MCYTLGLRITSCFYILMHILPMLLFENTSPTSCRSIFEIEGPLRDLINDFWPLLLSDITLSSKCWVGLCDMLHVLLYQILKIFAWSIINHIDLGFKETSTYFFKTWTVVSCIMLNSVDSWRRPPIDNWFCLATRNQLQELVIITQRFCFCTSYFLLRLSSCAMHYQVFVAVYNINISICNYCLCIISLFEWRWWFFDNIYFIVILLWWLYLALSELNHYLRPNSIECWLFIIALWQRSKALRRFLPWVLTLPQLRSSNLQRLLCGIVWSTPDFCVRRQGLLTGCHSIVNWYWDEKRFFLIVLVVLSESFKVTNFPKSRRVWHHAVLLYFYRSFFSSWGRNCSSKHILNGIFLLLWIAEETTNSLSVNLKSVIFANNYWLKISIYFKFFGLWIFYIRKTLSLKWKLIDIKLLWDP